MTITAGTAQDAIQAAIYARLANDSTLAGLTGGRIYDAVPEATVDNYVALGEWTEAAKDTLEDGNAGIGSDCTLTTHTYTDDARGAAGYKTGQAIDSRVKLLLHNTTLTIAGFACVLCQFEESASMRDEDNAGRPKRHIVSTYRILVDAT